MLFKRSFYLWGGDLTISVKKVAIRRKIRRLLITLLCLKLVMVEVMSSGYVLKVNRIGIVGESIVACQGQTKTGS